MDVEAYPDRIAYTGPREQTPETLHQLHRTHLLAVPFENLDIALGNRISIDLPLFFDKIVGRKRGGFCYELNGLFAWLLRQLGFPVTLLSACVGPAESPGAEFDHLILMVGDKNPMVADVGFGDAFLEPLSLDPDVNTHTGQHRLVRTDADWQMQKLQDSSWKCQYTFSLVPRQLNDFGNMCHHHQTSSGSHFTQKSTCTLPVERGRITLSGNRLIKTSGERRTETNIDDATECRALLKTRFGFDLEEDANVEMILNPPPG